MEELQPDDSQRLITKDELNLAEFPFSLPCHRAPKGRTSIQIIENGLDNERRPVERRWTVHASRAGLPLAIDEELFLGVMHFLNRNQFQDRHVYFTQHSLFQVLGWEPSQLAYERLKRSLTRLKGSTIECNQSFWDHKGKSYVDSEFSLIDSFSLYRRDDHRFEQPFISSVTFNEWIFESMKSGFIKTLDLNLYLTLKSPIARKLFRLLDKKLHRGEVFEIDVMKLANRLALTDSAYPADVRKQLERGAHAELVDIGFLRGVRYLRRGKTTSLEYRMAPREHWKFPEHKPRKLPAQAENPLVAELVKRGITRDVAVALVQAHSEKRVADKLEVFDHLRSTDSSMLSKNPAGFLRSSIEKDYAAPQGYVSRAERQRQRLEEVEARRREREVQQANDAAEAERQAKFEALWSSLTEEDRNSLEAQVLLTLNDFTRRAYEKEKSAGRVGAAHHTLRTGIADLLAARSATHAAEESQ